MIRYILGRLAALPISMFVVALLTFVSMQMVPGDAVDVMGGENLSTADMERLRAHYGLDQPVPVQLFYWVGNVLQGDFGMSISSQRPVLEEVLSRLSTTMELALLATVLSIAIGIVGGAIATRFRDSWIDKGIMFISTLGMSVPNYVATILFVLMISLYFPNIGVVSYAPMSEGVLANMGSLFFPALSLAILSGATFIRYVRGAAEDILRSADFVRTAKAKGASKRRILVRHVMPNTLIPLTTAAGLQLGYLVGGTVVIESIFALPGLGQLMLSAIGQRDYPVVQACVMLQAGVYVLVNLGVDLLYPFLDPRVRVSSSAR